MAYYSSLLSLSLCLLVLCHHGCSAARDSRQQQERLNRCRIQNLNPLQPSHRIQHQAGVTEQWDQRNDQFECAGVAATRHFFEPRGLMLPLFSNAPMLVYVVRGRGLLGTMFPGCPETYQSSQQSESEGGGQGQRWSRDQHQKIREVRQGDIIAVPAGVAHWTYNDGNSQLVTVVVHDTSNNENQLDQNLRRFFLAGNQQGRQPGSFGGQEQSIGNNIFQGFDTEILAEAFGINRETARRLQSENDERGNIVRVENGLRVLRPTGSEEEEGRPWRSNGMEETSCSVRIKENIANPGRADVYSARGGRISTINSLNLPILKKLQLSAERGVLYRNAMVAPHWNINAHSVMFVIGGSARVQIVGNARRPAFDGEVREGQFIVIPQNFAVVKQAGNQGFEWISFKTNDLAKTSPLAGRTSVIRAMPEEVLANAYQIPREEARRLKYNRDEVTILSPKSTSQERGSSWSIVP